MKWRQQIFDDLRQNPEVSVLIIGGGVNGTGTFRDLALQGVDVLLVEQGDFCSGASATSSHMAHGGIRYLENSEFRLVREALHERNRLLKNAPHYVKPLPTTIPIFRRFSGLLNAPLKFFGVLDKPSERGALVIKIGLVLYDWFTRKARVTPTHTVQSRQESLGLFPHLNPAIISTATYYDALILSPERVCLELILDAEEDSTKARALNYASAIGAEGSRVTLRDEVTGVQLSLRPQIVINAAGPWIDLANRALGHTTRFIGGTKGSHIVLDHPELLAATGGHEFFFENDDGRIVLILPFLDRVIVGTSDIPVDSPEGVQCTDEEIDYFLGMIRRVFPAIEINRSHIVFTFSGVRPLPASDAAIAGQISRDHSIQVVEQGEDVNFPIYNLIGGKWTTFRAFSEQTVDRVLERLGRRRIASTASLSIGKRARLISDPDYAREEIAALAQGEKVVHLDDILLRRTLLAMLGRLTGETIAEIGEIVGQALGWSAAEIQNEVSRSLEILSEHHRIPSLSLRSEQG